MSNETIEPQSECQDGGPWPNLKDWKPLLYRMRWCFSADLWVIEALHLLWVLCLWGTLGKVHYCNSNPTMNYSLQAWKHMRRRRPGRTESPCWRSRSPVCRWGRGQTWLPSELPGSASLVWWFSPPCPPSEPETERNNNSVRSHTPQIHYSVGSRFGRTSRMSLCRRLLTSSDLMRSLRAVSRSSSSSATRLLRVATRSFMCRSSLLCLSIASCRSPSFPQSSSGPRETSDKRCCKQTHTTHCPIVSWRLWETSNILMSIFLWVFL